MYVYEVAPSALQFMTVGFELWKRNDTGRQTHVSHFKNTIHL